MKRLIYAEDAMHRIEAETRFYSGIYAEIERAIDTAPTVESTRPAAHWIESGDSYEGLPIKMCSNCHMDIVLEDFQNYCPNCGARMVSDDT